MAPPYEPLWKVGDIAYWPEPYSLDPIPKDLRDGLIAVGTLAIISVGTTLTLISFISYRLITWKLHHSSFLGYNQYVLLVLNLLIADLQQSAAFLFSFHWIRLGRIMAPTRPCFGKRLLEYSFDNTDCVNSTSSSGVVTALRRCEQWLLRPSHRYTHVLDCSQRQTDIP